MAYVAKAGNQKISKSELGSKYTTNAKASGAVNTLTNAVDDFKQNNLNDYMNSTLRGDFITDKDVIQSALENATDAAYDRQRVEANQAANQAENSNYANTRNAVAELRRNLIGSASQGANVGAANATALQAILGLGQQNTSATTEAVNNISNVERQRAEAKAQNAVDAINEANQATSSMYGVATSAYGSDKQGAGERAAYAAQGLGNLAGAIDTNASAERMNGATNRTSVAVANTTQKSQNKTETKNRNDNYNH